MKNELNVLYQFDDNYSAYAGISMLSLLENNKTIENLNIFCATMNISEETRDLINKNAEEYNRKVTFINTDKALKKIKQLNVNEWNGSLATWMKIFVVEELIGKVDSLLYIDCDTLVLGGLNELCEFDFENKPMAAVIDSIGFEHLHRLGIESNKYYYNAGIMFFNLKYFYEHNGYYQKMLDHLGENINRYPINDQDLLNDFFCCNIKKMSPRYNFQGTHYMYLDNVYFKVYGRYDYYSLEELKESRRDVKIVHFLRVLGNYPWENANYHPLSNLYEEWKNKSLWKNKTNINKKRSLFFKIEIFLYKILPNVLFLKIFKYMKKRGMNK